MTDALLRATGVSKRFGNLAALETIDLAVRPRTVHAIIGPNGAGKTTLFNILSGELSPTSGSVALDGRVVTDLRPFERVRLGIGRSFQISSLFQNLTVFENARVATQARLGRGALNVWRRAERHAASADAARDLLQRVGLADVATVRAGELSHGRQRLLEVALALAAAPRLLLLDEPTAGMGIEEVERMRRLIVDLARDHTILLIEHNVALVMDVCQIVTVLDHGRLLTEGTPEGVSRDPRVREAYLGADL